MDFLSRLRYAVTNELSEEDRKEIITETISLNPTINELNSYFGTELTATGSKLTSATYYACMAIRCNSLAKLPIKLMKYNKNGSTRDHEHSLNTLIGLRPNPFMSIHDFLWSTEFMRLHYGNAFWVPEFKKDKIKALHLLNSSQVSMIIDDSTISGDKNTIIYVYNDSKKGTLVYTSEDICHFKNYSITGLEGSSVSKYIYETIANEQLSNQVLNKKYSTGLQDPIVVEYAGELNEKLSAKIKKKYESLGGTKNAGKVVPIPSEFKVSQLETKLVNSQFFELQGLTSRHIQNAFGVKSFQLNDLAKSTYNNVEQMNKAYYTDTLQDVLTSYEQEIDYKLLSENERKDHYFKFNVDSILRSDLAARTNSYSAGINNGYMTIAEVREKEDLPFIPGTERLVFGNGAAVFLEDVGRWKG